MAFFRNSSKTIRVLQEALRRCNAFDLREDEGKLLSPEQTRKLNQFLGTYHISALKNYHGPGVEIDTGPVAPVSISKKSGRPKKLTPVPSRDLNGTRGGIYNTH
ncbi:hypothetical protein NPIL_380711 [Nephila pilipes]|uniref:Uncharacterized protein n=1 Tax=Nephila pilipes TaxID=299642 RepID=A0A8X6QHW8_NEPPI|nr:hypothetical protein NPIL_380711 [Nephila pilipes]